MPKRNEAYMVGQRRAIVEGARDVLVEKGIRATSLRDICKAAGVSIGALYVHFATMEEVIAAACMLGWEAPDAGEWAKLSRIKTWDDYVSYMRNDVLSLTDPIAMSRFRLVLEWVAELAKTDVRPGEMTEILGHLHDWNRATLALIAESGEISLPLGLGPTVEIHLQLLDGAYYRAILNRDMPISQIADAMVLALGMTAGLREPAKSKIKTRPRTSGKQPSAPGGNSK